MDQGTINVRDRLVYRWHECYGIGVAPIGQMLKDWALAKRQFGLSYLREDVENIIVGWAKPGFYNLD